VDPASQAARQVEELALRLHEHVRQQGSSLAEVSRRLGRFPNSLSYAFSGRYPLKLKDVFGVFAALGTSAEDFFDFHYPLGGWRPPGFDPRRSALTEPGQQTIAEMLEDARRRQGLRPLGPPELVTRSGRLLQALILRAKTDQRAVSRALSLGQDTLAQALRGGIALTGWHLFGTLAVLDVDPGRFFAELFSRQQGEILPGLSRGDMLDLFDRLLGGAGRVLREREEREKAAAKPRKPASRRQRRPGDKGGKTATAPARPRGPAPKGRGKTPRKGQPSAKPAAGRKPPASKPPAPRRGPKGKGGRKGRRRT
jgi:hypothetical protein